MDAVVQDSMLQYLSDRNIVQTEIVEETKRFILSPAHFLRKCSKLVNKSEPAPDFLNAYIQQSSPEYTRSLPKSLILDKNGRNMAAILIHKFACNKQIFIWNIADRRCGNNLFSLDVNMSIC
jgi:hypothetical protein